ncbi:MAG: creatininase family protein [Rhodothermales bacterium]
MEVRLTHLTWKDVRERDIEVVVLPWGATEAHNTHLPHATDSWQAEGIAHLAARKAGERGARVVVLPTVPFGVHTQQADLPLTLNVNPSTQSLLLADLIQSVEDAGVAKMVIVNGHGANDFKQMLRELQAATPVFLCQCNWWTLGDASHVFDEPGDHAGELETSVMMHFHADTVRPLSEAGPGSERTFRIKALRDRRVWAPRQWSSVTEDTGVGNPQHASADKGRRFVEQVTEELAEFLLELDRADPSDLYA